MLSKKFFIFVRFATNGYFWLFFIKYVYDVLMITNLVINLRN